MRPIAAYKYGLKSLGRSPALVGVIAVFAVLNAVLGFVPIGVMGVLEQPFLGNIASLAQIPVYLLIGPAILGGVFAMTWQALDGRAGFGKFLAGVRSNYFHLLGWGVIVFAVEFAVVFVTVIVMWIVGIVLLIGMLGAGSAAGGTSGGMTGLSIAMLVIGALVGIVAMVIVLLPYAVFQFIPGAIVFEDHDFLDAGKRGLGLLRQNLKPTIGFDLTVLVLGLLFAAISYAAMFFVVDFGAMFSTDVASAGSSQMNPYASLGVIEIGALVGLAAVASTINGLIVIPAYAAFFRIVANT
ncbi:MAG: hypothetical protein ACOCYZ_01850 [Halococcoides sp.]